MVKKSGEIAISPDRCRGNQFISRVAL